MQGKQNTASSERKGPHKSMHCKFCKPPGVVTPEKATRPQLETKTKIHLAHEGADLRVCDIHDEPGLPEVVTEACVCVLEGENSCPKCVPDKKRAVLKKKTCRCPKGAKPNPNMDDGATPKKKKQKEEDDEFWWEKYSREHDAIAQETWAAYMAQRRKEKKLAKCQKREQEIQLAKHSSKNPSWYQKLSCQQMIYTEFLSTAIRLDSDENIIDRTLFVLGGIGLYPRPNRKVLKKCLRYCHYNSIQFLNQLHLLIKDDDMFYEKQSLSSAAIATQYTWNERLIMNAICHLEFPMLLRELMERLPPLPREKILPQIPYPVFPKLIKKKYLNPYEEPIWQDSLNWVDKMKIDRLNRCRAHMETKRIKIPALALVRRPSLIDARPPFLAQIEANEQASRRVQKQGGKKTVRKHPVSTFNSAVDVTAIAGIEASEVSTPDKPDTDEICVFLREPLKEPDFAEEEELEPEKEVRFLEKESETVATEISRVRPFPDCEESWEIEDTVIPFRTPPKTESGDTIEQPCLPPKASPGPPATHFDIAKRELDVINEEICRFYPFVSPSCHAIKGNDYVPDDEVTLQLISAAEKLREFAEEKPEVKDKKITKKKSGKSKRKRGSKKKKKVLEAKVSKGEYKKKKKSVVKIPNYSKEESVSDSREETTFDEWEQRQSDKDISEEDDLLLSFRSNVNKEKKKLNRKESIISDPDPDPDLDDDSPFKSPCDRGQTEIEEQPPKRLKRKLKKKKKKRVKSNKKKEKKVEGEKATKRKDFSKFTEVSKKVNKDTMTECYPGQYDNLYTDEKNRAKETKKVSERGSAYEGALRPLLSSIVKDLAEEGFISASYEAIIRHPDIEQLIQYLKGEIVTKKRRNEIHLYTKMKWMAMTDIKRFLVPELGLTKRQMKLATWKDKNWICRLARAKKDEFYFKVANARAEYGKKIYLTLRQNYFGTGRYLKIFYAYMLPKFEEAILRGIA